MQLLKRISLLFVAVLVSLSAMAQQREPESKPKQEEKPVLYIFSIPGCSPCKRLHDEALGEPEVTALLRRMEYHPVDMDFTKDAAGVCLSGTVTADEVGEEAFTYLENCRSLTGTPVERLRAMRQDEDPAFMGSQPSRTHTGNPKSQA